MLKFAVAQIAITTAMIKSPHSSVFPQLKSTSFQCENWDENKTSMKHGLPRPNTIPPLRFAIAQLLCDQALLISSIIQNACYVGYTNDYGKRAQWKPRRNFLQNAITTHGSSTIKTTQLTLALLIVGDHQRVNLLLGIWFKPDRCALVSFLYFMDSSNPLAFSQNRPSHVGKYVPLKSVCSRIPSTPPRAWIMSVR